MLLHLILSFVLLHSWDWVTRAQMGQWLVHFRSVRAGSPTLTQHIKSLTRPTSFQLGVWGEWKEDGGVVMCQRKEGWKWGGWVCGLQIATACSHMLGPNLTRGDGGGKPNASFGRVASAEPTLEVSSLLLTNYRALKKSRTPHAFMTPPIRLRQSGLPCRTDESIHWEYLCKMADTWVAQINDNSHDSLRFDLGAQW